MVTVDSGVGSVVVVPEGDSEVDPEVVAKVRGRFPCPVQVTLDLANFWRAGYPAVKKDLKGRYPRHPWPDDPASASATLRTKKADARNAAAR